MELAGFQAAQLYRARGPGRACRVLVLAGTGNNGGDGLVAARFLSHWGFSVTCIHFREPGSQLSPLCAVNRDRAELLGIPVLERDPAQPGPVIAEEPGFGVIDAVFGLGFRGTLPRGVSEAFRSLRQAGPAFRLAIDLPSGLHADFPGADAQDAFDCDVTVTFGAKKLAHAAAPSRHRCGDVIIADIGFPPSLSTAASSVHGTKAYWRRPSPGKGQGCHADGLARPSSLPSDGLHDDINKYDRGHVLVIGGSAGLSGAALLAAGAAARAGAGWVSLALSPDCAGERPVPPDIPLAPGIWEGPGVLDLEALASFVEHRQVKSLVIGCGMMPTALLPAIGTFLGDFVSAYGGSVALDAGALHEAGDWLTEAAVDWCGRLLLLPHPGEWRRMFRSVKAPGDFGSWADFSAVVRWSRQSRAAILYKAAAPVFADADRDEVFFHHTGSRALAKAGSGDVLAGICGALGCRWQDGPGSMVTSALDTLHDAAAVMVSLHGLDGGTAADLMAAVGRRFFRPQATNIPGADRYRPSETWTEARP